jgi:hypothetical protein
MQLKKLIELGNENAGKICLGHFIDHTDEEYELEFYSCKRYTVS